MEPNYMNFSLEAFSLKGKVAIITGANHGLGEVFAVALAKAGADLFITHHSADVSQVKAEIESIGRRVVFLQGDLTDEAHRAEAVEKCLEAYGKIDILVNNAGRTYNAPFFEFPDAEWKKVVDIQMDAVYYFSHAVAAVMAKQGFGKIINVASALSYAADPNSPAYTAAKHGVIGITRSLAVELGRYGVTCNAIAPGFFMTKVTDTVRALDPTIFDRVAAKIPLSTDGQWGKVEDLMGTIVYLASPASNYVNGELLAVDGGFKAQMI